MAAGPQLRAYGANLTQTGRNVHEVRAVVQSVRQQIDHIEMVIDAIDVIEQRADEFGDTVAKLKLALKLMDKTGPLKLVAKAGMAVLDGVQRVAQAIEDKADQLARKIDDSRLEQKLADAGERRLARVPAGATLMWGVGEGQRRIPWPVARARVGNNSGR